MEKIKFKNTKKYKGIVEKVFVKEGQPVKRNEILAVISTQLEKFEIRSTIEGVIRNIYVIESLIVSNGDTVFDIFSDKEINNLLKKPSNINDTLREGLNEFGYLEKLINEPELNEINEDKEFVIEVEDSLTEELSNLSDLENQYYKELEITESLDKIEDNFEINIDIENTNLDQYKNEESVEESELEFDSFEPPKFSKSESNIIDLDIKPLTVADSITEELAINHAIVYEDEKDIEIFSDHNPVISETQVLEKVSNQNFLSKFTSDADGRELESEILITENSDREDQKIKENKEIIQEVKDEISKEKKELERKVENDKKEFSLDGPKFDYLSELENEKIDILLKNSEELETKFYKIKNQKEELEEKIKNIDNKINKYSSRLKNNFENTVKEINVEKFEEKIQSFDEKLSSFISKTKEENSQTINSLLKKVNDKINDLDLKIKQSSNLTNNSLISEKNSVIDNVKIDSFSYKLDITALISLQTLMAEPLKKKGIELELNAFFVKALTKTLDKFNELNSSNSAIRLIKSRGFNLNDTIVKVQKDTNILNISREINKNIETKNEKINVSLFDLSNFGVDNANFGLSKDSIISIYASTISNSFKEDGNLSNFIKINFAFNSNKLEPEDAILFGKEFISLLKNPGFLI
ncbi:biotin/lipoyl-containing protein [Spiroplasma diminutum]|uniref:Lipoyl-binding domain-containing protein n=1 Tax=Spiroplasma diminutum CUAS-1 TaxID=1276221 RepID=S5MK66_9MOLU|nr:biotin/lipoyl-containing protein [Spiroplasma diminutum]AGR42365.1 hypothetical protein SDIMI_v3c06610 [Spiroplasma diminutum CUAS-1]